VVVTNLDAFLASMAALQLSMHNSVVLAEKGLISPDRVDEAIDGVTASLEGITPELCADIQKNLDPLFTQLKLLAAQNWDDER
jgi:hypothetical protein